MAKEPALSEQPTTRPMTGDEYLESLRDGRAVYAYGERVEDVTTHPAFATPVRTIARMYDALHDPGSGMATVPTDTGSGGFTHPFFRVARTVDDLRASRDAIAHWARMSYGWMGRTPDYKAAFLATLGSNGEFFAPYQENAARWYRESQEKVLFWNHALANPPVDRHLPADQVGDVVLHVERETDAGLVVAGAKVVATGAAMTHMTFLADAGAPVKDKRFAIIAGVPMDAPGLKLISRASYSLAARAGSPYDYPLSSRFDENDPILVLDDVLIPWENVFAYGDAKPIGEGGFGVRLTLHGATRLAVKLDFLCGLLIRSLELAGKESDPGLRTRAGEALAWRNMAWSLTDSMVLNPEQGVGGALDPNLAATHAYRWLSMVGYSRVRQIILQDLGSALIYLPSSAKDFESPEIRPYLDKYVRGTGGVDAEHRVKTLKMMWDAVGTEFGGRHELYELNYQGSQDVIRTLIYQSMRGTGHLDGMMSLVDRALSEYDLEGWIAPDYRG